MGMRYSTETNKTKIPAFMVFTFQLDQTYSNETSTMYGIRQ